MTGPLPTLTVDGVREIRAHVVACMIGRFGEIWPIPVSELTGYHIDRP